MEKGWAGFVLRQGWRVESGGVGVSCSRGRWLCKAGGQRAQAGCLAWCAVLLGQQKGRLDLAAHRGSVCPVVGHLNPTESRAIRLIIARRIDVCNSSFAPLFKGVWSTSCFRTWYLQASAGRFADCWDGAGRRRSGRLFRWVWPPALLGSWATGIPLLLDGRGWSWPVAR